MNKSLLTLPDTHEVFTLMELLIVIGIIGIIASLIIVAINPGKQIEEAYNAKRRADANTISNAVRQYAIDHGGIPDEIPSSPTPLCKYDASCTNGVSLNVLVNGYLATIPSDPKARKSGTGTDYLISRTVKGDVVISAPNTESYDQVGQPSWLASLLGN